MKIRFLLSDKSKNNMTTLKGISTSSMSQVNLVDISSSFNTLVVLPRGVEIFKTAVQFTEDLISLAQIVMNALF